MLVMQRFRVGYVTIIPRVTCIFLVMTSEILHGMPPESVAYLLFNTMP